MGVDGPRAATLDEALVERVRRRIGIPLRSRQRPHNETATADGIRHYALGYGDDNPLWCDETYARQTGWGGVIAPPMYPLSAGLARKVAWSPAQEETMSAGDPLASIGQYMCGERWVFGRPVRPGDRLTKQQSLDDAQLKRSEFGGGCGALLSHRVEYALEADDEPVSLRYLDFWHAEREKSAASGKYREITPHHYTDNEIAEYDQLYADERIRGDQHRLWEEVQTGDNIGAIAKGPLTLTDIITYHTAIGWGGYGGGTGKVAYQNRQRIPKFYVPNELGVPDSAQRCHWEASWAQRLGHPAPYDYGAMRTNWMVHLITNWMGDSGWLWKLSATVMKFNYLGDAHRLSGHVTALRQGSGIAEADVAVVGVNQRDVTTCRATGTVLLPTTAQPVVIVPSLQESEVPPAVGPDGASSEEVEV